MRPPRIGGVLMGRMGRVAFLLFGTVLFASTADADLITFQFSGAVCCFGGVLPGGVGIGNTVSGSYTFDPLTPPTDVGVATQYRGTVKALDFHVGPFSGLSGLGTGLPGGGSNVIQIGNATPGSGGADTYNLEVQGSGRSEERRVGKECR